VIVSPPAAIKARTAISISIIYSTVISDIPSPIAMMEAIIATAVTPIARSPEIPIFRRFYPLSRHPIKIISVISPVTWCPKITIIRAQWLCIIRKPGRGMVYPDDNSHSDPGGRSIRCSQKGQHKE